VSLNLAHPVYGNSGRQRVKLSVSKNVYSTTKAKKRIPVIQYKSEKVLLRRFPELRSECSFWLITIYGHTWMLDQRLRHITALF